MQKKILNLAFVIYSLDGTAEKIIKFYSKTRNSDLTIEGRIENVRSSTIINFGKQDLASLASKYNLAYVQVLSDFQNRFVEIITRQKIDLVFFIEMSAGIKPETETIIFEHVKVASKNGSRGLFGTKVR